jgi:hypothetical protein
MRVEQDASQQVAVPCPVPIDEIFLLLLDAQPGLRIFPRPIFVNGFLDLLGCHRRLLWPTAHIDGRNGKRLVLLFPLRLGHRQDRIPKRRRHGLSRLRRLWVLLRPEYRHGLIRHCR